MNLDEHKRTDSKKTFKGQISLATALIGATGMVIASAFTAWATVTNGVSDVRTEVSVVQERENNHYAEVQKQLEAISKKLDNAPWAKQEIISKTQP